jgi:hypothetical protein
MTKSLMLAAVTAAVILTGAAGAATAAPAGALVGAGDAIRGETNAVENVGYRCWWHPYRGRVCAWAAPRVQHYGFYGSRPWGGTWGYRHGFRRHW